MMAVLLALLVAWEVRVVEAPPPDGVPAAIAKGLDAKAMEIRDGDATVMTLWLRKELPAKATAEQIKNGLTARELVEGSLVGMVKLPATWIDYRKQEIPAGLYTLRLAFQPDTGDHKGTAPHAEFLLLSPIADDADPAEREAKAIVEASRKATGGDHPAVMLLVPSSHAGDAPKLTEANRGVRTVHLRRPISLDGQAATMALGLTVSGSSEAR
jgi:hypothetical protein